MNPDVANFHLTFILFGCRRYNLQGTATLNQITKWVELEN